jgi:hypothetical protein
VRVSGGVQTTDVPGRSGESGRDSRRVSVTVMDILSTDELVDISRRGCEKFAKRLERSVNVVEIVEEFP